VNPVQSPGTDWASAISILAAGLILGALFVFYFKRRKSSSATLDGDIQRNDLEAKRDALLQQLHDPDLDPTERTRLELETAQTLRALDGLQSPLPVARGEGEGSLSTGMSPATKGFLWGAGSVAALAGLFYFVMQQATPRTEGGSLTGAVGGETQTQTQAQPQQAQADPMLMQLEAAVQREPDNLQLRNDLAQAYLERDNLMAVFEQTKIVLAKSPNDSRSLTFQGLVRMAMGETAVATQMLQQATKVDPKNLDGWVALAWVYAQSDRMKEAEATMAEAARQSPNDRARLEEVLGQMKKHVEEAKNQPAQAAGALPQGHPPVDAPAAAPQAPATPAVAPVAGAVTVTLTLDPSASARSGVVFVMVKNPGGGPPIAVKRVVAMSFPTTVQISSADSMMGQPLPASFRLEVRLDTDGDAMTKNPTDPKALQDGVTAGSSVTLALK
jgi:tetratricopeptide (TPR) repeat protein